ncbi:Hypothetical protein, partial CDS, partial [Neorhizobium galegae bv. officinalis]
MDCKTSFEEYAISEILQYPQPEPILVKRFRVIYVTDERNGIDKTHRIPFVKVAVLAAQMP